ncbi:MAG: transposase [Candidatus Competibacteraceae bacterium]|nr:transposase [Candidatus Competibacteraceae bacterium]
MWLLRKKPDDLTSKDQETLDQLFKYSPLLQHAYPLKNELTGLFESDLNRRRGKQRITGWMNRVKKRQSFRPPPCNGSLPPMGWMWKTIAQYSDGPPCT